MSNRIVFDCEFIEDGRTIDLISIGLVKDNGEELYMVSSEFDEGRANPWVKENVLPKLSSWPRIPRHHIRDKLVEFAGPDPKFWAYFASYDWVALCQLFGAMIDLPHNFPMFCRDIKQLLSYHKMDARQLVQPDPGQLHHALYDARWESRVLDELIKRLQGPL